MKKSLLVFLTASVFFVTHSNAQTLPSYVPTNGLVAAYFFNGNTNDISGNGNNGTNNGAALTTDRFGNSSSAYSFNGTSSWIEIPHNSNINFSLTQNYSVSVWIKPSLSCGASDVLGKWVNSLDPYPYTFHYSGPATTQPFITTARFTGGSIQDSTQVQSATYNFSMTTSTYQHWVAVYTTDTIKLYLNSNLVAVGRKYLSSGSISNTYNLFIGRRSGRTDRFFNGIIDDIGIWNRALTQQEITTLFTGCNMSSVSITPTSATTFCLGNSVVLNSSLSGSSYTYTWKLTGNAISGATANNYTATQGGAYTLKVDSSSCSVTSTPLSVIVNQPPSVSITPFSGTINIKTNSLALSGTPTGGTFTGQGVAGNNFYPSTAGLGTKTIGYSYTDGNGCSNSTSRSTIIYDTVTCYVSITDTLIINVLFTGIAPPSNLSSMKIYPNPAKDHIYIDNGNITKMIGYQVKVTTSTGQQVFLGTITQQQFYIDLSSWSGKGLYFVQILNAQGNVVEVRKILLQ